MVCNVGTITAIKHHGQFFRENDDGSQEIIDPRSIVWSHFLSSDFAYLPNASLAHGDNFSKQSMEWLQYRQSLLPPNEHIQHAMTAEGEKVLRLTSNKFVRPDGYSASTKTLFEFYVSVW